MILVDKTGWIYIEFLNHSEEAATNCLKTDYLLKNLTLNIFNIFIENFLLENNEYQRLICIQTNLLECKINFEKVSLLSHNNNDCRLALNKTTQLNKLFYVEQKTQTSETLIDDTFDESNPIFDAIFELNENELKISQFYFFKVINKGCIYTMSNTQFQAKLRADIEIELIDLNHLNQTTSKYIVMSLVSKFLYYYNFLHTDCVYLLKSNQNIDISFIDSIKEINQNLGILFLNDNMFIIDNFKSIINKVNFKQNLKIKNNNDLFIKKKTGILVSKRLKTNQLTTNRSDSNNCLITEYYDALLPNKEFQFKLQTDQNELITIYFDTKFSMYSFCVLPGMSIDIYNLVKKGGGDNNTYKATSNVHASIRQENLIKSSLTYKSELIKFNRFECLNNLDFIYNNFYSDLNLNKASSKLVLLDSDKKTNLLLQTKLQVLAQIIRIYDLTLRIKCVTCCKLASLCACTDVSKQFKIELNMTFLIDDHTSLIKLNYSNFNFNFKYNQSGLFSSIGEQLHSILLNYLNEIKLTNLQTTSMDLIEYNNSNNNKQDTTILQSNNNDLDFFFENNVKPDIYKCLSDYLMNCFLEKYFLFQIDYSNEYESSRTRFKTEFSLFKLSQLASNNEQFKSILNVKCFEFISVDKAFIF